MATNPSGVSRTPYVLWDSCPRFNVSSMTSCHGLITGSDSGDIMTWQYDPSGNSEQNSSDSPLSPSLQSQNSTENINGAFFTCPSPSNPARLLHNALLTEEQLSTQLNSVYSGHPAPSILPPVDTQSLTPTTFTISQSGCMIVAIVNIITHQGVYIKYNKLFEKAVEFDFAFTSPSSHYISLHADGTIRSHTATSSESFTISQQPVQCLSTYRPIDGSVQPSPQPHTHNHDTGAYTGLLPFYPTGYYWGFDSFSDSFDPSNGTLLNTKPQTSSSNTNPSAGSNTSFIPSQLAFSANISSMLNSNSFAPTQGFITSIQGNSNGHIKLISSMNNGTPQLQQNRLETSSSIYTHNTQLLNSYHYTSPVLILYGSKSSITIIDASTGQNICKLSHSDSIIRCELSANNSYSTIKSCYNQHFATTQHDELEDSNNSLILPDPTLALPLDYVDAAVEEEGNAMVYADSMNTIPEHDSLSGVTLQGSSLTPELSPMPSSTSNLSIDTDKSTNGTRKSKRRIINDQRISPAYSRKRYLHVLTADGCVHIWDIDKVLHEQGRFDIIKQTTFNTTLLSPKKMGDKNTKKPLQIKVDQQFNHIPIIRFFLTPPDLSSIYYFTRELKLAKQYKHDGPEKRVVEYGRHYAYNKYVLESGISPLYNVMSSFLNHHYSLTTNASAQPSSPRMVPTAGGPPQFSSHASLSNPLSHSGTSPLNNTTPNVYTILPPANTVIQKLQNSSLVSGNTLYNKSRLIIPPTANISDQPISIGICEGLHIIAILYTRVIILLHQTSLKVLGSIYLPVLKHLPNHNSTPSMFTSLCWLHGGKVLVVATDTCLLGYDIAFESQYDPLLMSNVPIGAETSPYRAKYINTEKNTVTSSIPTQTTPDIVSIVSNNDVTALLGHNSTFEAFYTKYGIPSADPNTNSPEFISFNIPSPARDIKSGDFTSQNNNTTNISHFQTNHVIATLYTIIPTFQHVYTYCPSKDLMGIFLAYTTSEADETDYLSSFSTSDQGSFGLFGLAGKQQNANSHIDLYQSSIIRRSVTHIEYYPFTILPFDHISTKVNTFYTSPRILAQNNVYFTDRTENLEKKLADANSYKQFTRQTIYQPILPIFISCDMRTISFDDLLLCTPTISTNTFNTLDAASNHAGGSSVMNNNHMLFKTMQQQFVKLNHPILNPLPQSSAKTILTHSPSGLTSSPMIHSNTHSNLFSKHAILTHIITDVQTGCIIFVRGYRSGHITFNNITSDTPPFIITHPMYPFYLSNSPAHPFEIPYPVSFTSVFLLGVCGLCALFSDSSVAVYTINTALQPQKQPNGAEIPKFLINYEQSTKSAEIINSHLSPFNQPVITSPFTLYNNYENNATNTPDPDAPRSKATNNSLLSSHEEYFDVLDQSVLLSTNEGITQSSHSNIFHASLPLSQLLSALSIPAKTFSSAYMTATTQQDAISCQATYTGDTLDKLYLSESDLISIPLNPSQSDHKSNTNDRKFDNKNLTLYLNNKYPNLIKYLSTTPHYAAHEAQLQPLHTTFISLHLYLKPPFQNQLYNSVHYLQSYTTRYSHTDSRLSVRDMQSQMLLGGWLSEINQHRKFLLKKRILDHECYNTSGFTEYRDYNSILTPQQQQQGLGTNGDLNSGTIPTNNNTVNAIQLTSPFPSLIYPCVPLTSTTSTISPGECIYLTTSQHQLVIVSLIDKTKVFTLSPHGSPIIRVIHNHFSVMSNTISTFTAQGHLHIWSLPNCNLLEIIYRSIDNSLKSVNPLHWLPLYAHIDIPVVQNVMFNINFNRYVQKPTMNNVTLHDVMMTLKIAQNSTGGSNSGSLSTLNRQGTTPKIPDNVFFGPTPSAFEHMDGSGSQSNESFIKGHIGSANFHSTSNSHFFSTSNRQSLSVCTQLHPISEHHMKHTCPFCTAQSHNLIMDNLSHIQELRSFFINHYLNKTGSSGPTNDDYLNTLQHPLQHEFINIINNSTNNKDNHYISTFLTSNIFNQASQTPHLSAITSASTNHQQFPTVPQYIQSFHPSGQECSHIFILQPNYNRFQSYLQDVYQKIDYLLLSLLDEKKHIIQTANIETGQTSEDIQYKSLFPMDSLLDFHNLLLNTPPHAHKQNDSTVTPLRSDTYINSYQFYQQLEIIQNNRQILYNSFEMEKYRIKRILQQHGTYIATILFDLNAFNFKHGMHNSTFSSIVARKRDDEKPPATPTKSPNDRDIADFEDLSADASLFLNSANIGADPSQPTGVGITADIARLQRQHIFSASTLPTLYNQAVFDSLNQHFYYLSTIELQTLHGMLDIDIFTLRAHKRIVLDHILSHKCGVIPVISTDLHTNSDVQLFNKDLQHSWYQHQIALLQQHNTAKNPREIANAPHSGYSVGPGVKNAYLSSNTSSTSPTSSYYLNTTGGGAEMSIPERIKQMQLLQLQIPFHDPMSLLDHAGFNRVDIYNEDISHPFCDCVDCSLTLKLSQRSVAHKHYLSKQYDELRALSIIPPNLHPNSSTDLNTLGSVRLGDISRGKYRISPLSGCDLNTSTYLHALTHDCKQHLLNYHKANDVHYNDVLLCHDCEDDIHTILPLLSQQEQMKQQHLSHFDENVQHSCNNPRYDDYEYMSPRTDQIDMNNPYLISSMPLNGLFNSEVFLTYRKFRGTSSQDLLFNNSNIVFSFNHTTAMLNPKKHKKIIDSTLVVDTNASTESKAALKIKTLVKNAGKIQKTGIHHIMNGENDIDSDDDDADASIPQQQQQQYTTTTTTTTTTTGSTATNPLLVSPSLYQGENSVTITDSLYPTLGMIVINNNILSHDLVSIHQLCNLNVIYDSHDFIRIASIYFSVIILLAAQHDGIPRDVLFSLVENNFMQSHATRMSSCRDQRHILQQSQTNQGDGILLSEGYEGYRENVNKNEPKYSMNSSYLDIITAPTLSKAITFVYIATHFPLQFQPDFALIKTTLDSHAPPITPQYDAPPLPSLPFKIPPLIECLPQNLKYLYPFIITEPLTTNIIGPCLQNLLGTASLLMGIHVAIPSLPFVPIRPHPFLPNCSTIDSLSSFFENITKEQLNEQATVTAGDDYRNFDSGSLYTNLINGIESEWYSVISTIHNQNKYSAIQYNVENKTNGFFLSHASFTDHGDSIVIALPLKKHKQLTIQSSSSAAASPVNSPINTAHKNISLPTISAPTLSQSISVFNSNVIVNNNNIKIFNTMPSSANSSSFLNMGGFELPALAQALSVDTYFSAYRYIHLHTLLLSLAHLLQTVRSPAIPPFIPPSLLHITSYQQHQRQQQQIAVLKQHFAQQLQFSQPTASSAATTGPSLLSSYLGSSLGPIGFGVGTALSFFKNVIIASEQQDFSDHLVVEQQKVTSPGLLTPSPIPQPSNGLLVTPSFTPSLSNMNSPGGNPDFTSHHHMFKQNPNVNNVSALSTMDFSFISSNTKLYTPHITTIAQLLLSTNNNTIYRRIAKALLSTLINTLSIEQIDGLRSNLVYEFSSYLAHTVHPALYAHAKSSIEDASQNKSLFKTLYNLFNFYKNTNSAAKRANAAKSGIGGIGGIGGNSSTAITGNAAVTPNTAGDVDGDGFNSSLFNMFIHNEAYNPFTLSHERPTFTSMSHQSALLINNVNSNNNATDLFLFSGGNNQNIQSTSTILNNSSNGIPMNTSAVMSNARLQEQTESSNLPFQFILPYNDLFEDLSLCSLTLTTGQLPFSVLYYRVDSEPIVKQAMHQYLSTYVQPQRNNLASVGSSSSSSKASKNSNLMQQMYLSSYIGNGKLHPGIELDDAHIVCLYLLSTIEITQYVKTSQQRKQAQQQQVPQNISASNNSTNNDSSSSLAQSALLRQQSTTNIANLLPTSFKPWLLTFQRAYYIKLTSTLLPTVPHSFPTPTTLVHNFITTLVTGRNSRSNVVENRLQMITHYLLLQLQICLSFWDIGCKSLYEANMVLQYLSSYYDFTHYINHMDDALQQPSGTPLDDVGFTGYQQKSTPQEGYHRMISTILGDEDKGNTQGQGDSSGSVSGSTQNIIIQKSTTVQQINKTLPPVLNITYVRNAINFVGDSSDFSSSSSSLSSSTAPSSLNSHQQQLQSQQSLSTTVSVPIVLTARTVCILTLLCSQISKGYPLWARFITNKYDLITKLHHLSQLYIYPNLSQQATIALLQIGKHNPNTFIRTIVKNVLCSGGVQIYANLPTTSTNLSSPPPYSSLQQLQDKVGIVSSGSQDVPQISPQQTLRTLNQDFFKFCALNNSQVSMQTHYNIPRGISIQQYTLRDYQDALTQDYHHQSQTSVASNINKLTHSQSSSLVSGAAGLDASAGVSSAGFSFNAFANLPQSNSTILLTLITFIHKYPDVCYPYIPTLAQFIVRALDPQQPQQRKALLKHTSLLIQVLINTYPNISFDKGTQRLVVSTHTHSIASGTTTLQPPTTETNIFNNLQGLPKQQQTHLQQFNESVASECNAVICYDLRSGNKIRTIFEKSANPSPITACSIAPQQFGNYCITYSAFEHPSPLLKVWQLPSTSVLGSFFNSQPKMIQCYTLPRITLSGVKVATSSSKYIAPQQLQYVLKNVKIKWEMSQQGKHTVITCVLVRENNTEIKFNINS